jgi:predicted XRE-type DNA-binding protein
MQLTQYLVENQISQKEFSQLLEVSQPTVHKWLNKKAIPSGRRIIQIYQLTEGEVSAEDFIDGKV